jgi:hypothetical protein
LISCVWLPWSGFSLWCKEFPLCNQMFVFNLFIALTSFDYIIFNWYQSGFTLFGLIL